VPLNHRIDGPDDAPVLLLGCSLGTNLAMWEPQIRHFRQRFRVVAFDTRGHGHSPVPPTPYAVADLGGDVLGLMDELRIDRAAYAGISIGGMTGIWLGANAAQRFEKLVLLCTSAYAPPASRWLDRASAVRAAGTTEVIADAVVERWFTPAWAVEHPDAVATHRAMIVATDPEGYSGCCEALAAMDLRDDLPRVTVPTLVIGGRQDLALPPEHQRLIADSIPEARLELIEVAAHIATAEQPETINRLIGEHLSA
jgi:3-oxoadipate enol-lactonase